MATNNSINNTLPSPFSIDATSVTATGTELNLVNGLTIGASGNIMTSNGTGIVSSAPNAVGTLQLISTQIASSSASISFTGLSSTYSYYYVVISNLLPATNAVVLTMQVSTNNGSSYSAAGYYYAQTAQNSGAGTGTVSAANAASFQITGSQTNAANNTGSLVVEIINPSQSTESHHFLNNCIYVNSAGGIDGVEGGCTWVTTTAINAVQFAYSSGNISTGTFKLYGVLA